MNSGTRERSHALCLTRIEIAKFDQWLAKQK
jgi:hypothetical protein